MKTLISGLSLLVMSGLPQQASSPKRLTAPTYYISVRARACDPNEIRFSGASNLPPGAVLAVRVSDADQDAWKDYSENMPIEVNEAGLFDGNIGPKSKMTFHRNLTLIVDFTTYSPKQSDDTLRVLGPKGENLGGLKNPQVFQTSGQHFGLQAIDRVPFCGEGLK